MPSTTNICPDFCANPHREQPGDAVHHHTSPIEVPQAEDGRPLHLVAGFYDHDRMPRLDIGQYSLDLTGARQLLAELQVKVAFLERLAATLDVDAHLDRLLNQYQVGA